jgi:hypothetical protein
MFLGRLINVKKKGIIDFIRVSSVLTSLSEMMAQIRSSFDNLKPTVNCAPAQNC